VAEAGSTGAGSRRGALIFAGVLLAAAAIAAVVVIATGGEDDAGSAGLPEGCEEAEAAEPKDVALKRPRDLEPTAASAVVETSCGSFEIALDAERAPTTVASFEYMVEEGVYDGTGFHRVAPGFVIQGGDPAGDGTGDAGYSVDEAPPQDLSYTRGTVAMAKTAAEPPGRSGSQFFVVVGADAGLPTDYALLGEVTEGFEVVERIAELADPSVPDGPPASPAVIETITLEQGA
jgi:cyclophilin family peptidyl-prolyl cis-trans isomerase